MALRFSLRRFELPFLGKAWIAALFAVILLLVGVGLALMNERAVATEQARRATVQAQILAGSVSAALAFDDRSTAQEYLKALHANSEIDAAGIYGQDGALVAGFATSGGPLPKYGAPQRPRVAKGRLSVAVAVTQGNLQLGTVYLRTVVEPWTRRASRYVAIGIILTLAALLIAVLGSSYSAASEAYASLQRETEARERAEAALRQAQKMEAMGQLTGGVAHDFNNLLMAASSGVELLQRTDDPKRRERLVQGIKDALDRGAKLTQQLLTFARRTLVKPEVIDVGVRLQGIRDLLDRSLREDVHVEFHVDEDLWPIEVDPAQFDIAVVNIAVNARDAMPRGGEIDIEASNLPGGLDGDDAVEIRIVDQGTGMPAETVEKAFEPFFTTKGVGRGTGLGLSQVYGFARAAGGMATIESKMGEGTTVCLVLPRCMRAAAQQAHRTSAHMPDLKNEKLLVVEDDDQIADMLQQMVGELGGRAIRASTAEEGLKLFERESPDGIISDMVMPGEWDGLELVRQVRRRNGQVPVLLMTGYSSAAAQAREEGYTLLEKPFNLEQLARGLSEVFGART
jgi:signal transduction histidine kinase